MKKILFLIFCLVISASINAQSGTGFTSSRENPNEGLAKLAQKVRPGFLLGSFHTPGHLGLDPKSPDNAQLIEIFRNNFNIVTVGIFMFVTQREPGKYDPERFENIDKMVEFANSNNIKVYFHLLIGGAYYSPEWINKGNLTKAELEKIMRDRITFILTRYGNKVQYVDVVNEALASGKRSAEGEFDWRVGDNKGEHIWMKTMGMYQGKKYKFPQYLVDAFRIAREVGDKNLRLILNEFDNQTINSPKGEAFLALVKALREEGIPVDGAGIQLHCRIKDGKFYDWSNPFDFDAFDAMLNKYEQAGIPIHITEFDIHLPPNPTDADFQLQGKCYAEVLRHAIQSPAVKTFKTWGFTDRYSWKIDGKDSHPLLLDENLKPKPAYIQQVEMLKSLARVKK